MTTLTAAQREWIDDHDIAEVEADLHGTDTDGDLPDFDGTGTNTIEGSMGDCTPDFWWSDAAWTEEDLTTSAKIKIHGHSYKPDPKFFGEALDGRFFGWEWEIASKKGLSLEELEWILEPINEELYYVKRDCTVDFEIVFHPMAEDYFKEQLKAGLGEAMRRADTLCDDMRRAGSHLHVSRSSIACKGETIQRVVRNAVAHMDVEAELCRDRNDLEQWADPSIEGNWNRYAAVNLMNKATVEFRLFGGTNDPERIVANIDLCNAWIEKAETVGDELSPEAKERLAAIYKWLEPISEEYELDIPSEYLNEEWLMRRASYHYIIAFARTKHDLGIPYRYGARVRRQYRHLFGDEPGRLEGLVALLISQLRTEGSVDGAFVWDLEEVFQWVVSYER